MRVKLLPTWPMIHRFPGAAAALAAGLSLAVAACAGGPSYPMPDDKPGLYEFEGRVTGAARVSPMRGTIEVERDTVMVIVDGAHCRPLLGNVQSYAHQCGEDLTFSFDRLHPLRRPRVQMVRQVPYTRRVCERYRQSPSGSQVCVLWGTVTDYRTERHAVHLTVLPVRTEPFRP